MSTSITVSPDPRMRCPPPMLYVTHFGRSVVFAHDLEVLHNWLECLALISPLSIQKPKWVRTLARSVLSLPSSTGKMVILSRSSSC